MYQGLYSSSSSFSSSCQEFSVEEEESRPRTDSLTTQEVLQILSTDDCRQALAGHEDSFNFSFVDFDAPTQSTCQNSRSSFSTAQRLPSFGSLSALPALPKQLSQKKLRPVKMRRDEGGVGSLDESLSSLFLGGNILREEEDEPLKHEYDNEDRQVLCLPPHP